MTEEEVKARVVLPWLQQLGLDPAELRLETSFRLNVGRHRLITGPSWKTGTIGARLDFHVIRGTKSLFIIEVKRDGLLLSEHDRDQAISYARLVHPIAPYAVVTNGQDWQLYDTVTKDQLEPGAVSIRGYDAAVLPDDARNEALEFFLGYSAENLLRFCHAQVKEQMKPLRGSPTDLTKKYIPELTVPRGEFLKALVAFEQGSETGFLVLADSGRGKTSALCDYVNQRLQSGRPTLFFAGGAIEASLLDAVVDEFSWVFTEQVSGPALVKRIGRLSKTEPVVIVVDAMDEWRYSQRAPSLLKVLRGAQHENVKLVFSCKSGAWDAIAKPDGSDIGIAEHLCKPIPEVSRTDNRPRQDPDGYEFGTFSPPEFWDAVYRYRAAFGVEASFEKALIEEAKRNPFLLRVLFVVAAETGQQALTFGSRELFERYYDVLKRKTGCAELAEAQLVGVARVLYDRNCAVVSAADLRTELGLSITETLLPALFEHNILQRTVDGITFYFQQLRDYLIAFHAQRWHEVAPKDLARIKPTGVRGEALTFYLRYATEEQLRAVTGDIIPNAERYLDRYLELREKHFPALIQEFWPRADGLVGFIADYIVPEQRLGLYGFLVRDPEQPAVQLVPVDRFNNDHSLRDHLFGAASAHYYPSCNGFLSLDVTREVMRAEIIDQLIEIVNERRLPVIGCPKLVAEAVIGTVLSDACVKFPEPVAANGRPLFPSLTADIRRAMRRLGFHQQFRNELIKQKLADGRIQRQWSKSGKGYSFDPKITPEEEALLARQVEHALATDAELNGFGGSLNLVRLEESFRRAGVYDADFAIDELPWYTRDDFLEWDQNGEQGLAEVVQYHLEELFTAFLSEYPRVVDSCFPTLTEAFALRCRMPVRLLIKTVPTRQRQWPWIDGSVRIVYEQLEPGMNNEVVLCSPEELVYEDGVLKHKGRPIEDRYSEGTGLSRFIYQPGSSQPLHDLVYGQIQRELPEAIDLLGGELLDQYRSLSASQLET
jgi:hypothetical protein